MMIPANGLPVDDDVLDRIFHFTSSVDALASMALTCKSFYNVFSRHPTSINRATAYNIAGPALPQAIRVVRCPQYVEICERDEEDMPAVETTFPPETEVDAEALSVTTAELRKLKHVADIAVKLENLYSIRYKDRTSKKSKLLGGESWRFRRALYRIMLFHRVFPLERYVDEQEVRDDDEDYVELDDDTRELVDDKRIKAEREARQLFLQRFYLHDVSELSDLQILARFLSQVARETSHPNHSSPISISTDHGLVVGPEGIYNMYCGLSLPRDTMFAWLTSLDSDRQPLEGYLSDPIKALSEAKGLGVIADDATQWRTLLESKAEGEDDTCKQCGKPEGLNLWGEQNWEHVPGVSRLNERQIMDLVPGNLVRNVGYPQPRERLLSRLQNDGLPSFLNGLFAVKRSPEFDTWNKEDWICLECLKTFIAANVVEWFLEQRRQSGAPVLEDCWYGYNCRTQTHRAAHANKLNHFCEQKRES